MNQYYRVHAVIDLDAICHNIREVKRVVGEGVKVMPVIKADGYGHGTFNSCYQDGCIRTRSSSNCKRIK